MKLIDLIDNSLTDKNTTHSYMDLYEKETAKNVLEIGLGSFQEKNGGSIKLWRDYFTNAKIFGIDILSEDRVIDELKNDDRVVLHTLTNAYDETFVKTHLSHIKFDFLLDDGPHTLESMKQFINLYSQILTDDGILIIEDVQDWSWIEILTNEVPENLQNFIYTYDLRQNKNRYDDIVFVINKKSFKNFII